MTTQILTAQQTFYQSSQFYTPFLSHRICLIHTSEMPYESDLARRWWSLPSGTTLPLHDGSYGRLVFCGRPGSSAGPDVHDAILLLPVQPIQGDSPSHHTTAPVQQHIGDVEFHIHARDWYLHQHHRDPRYNNVLLHVVLSAYPSQKTLRQDGIAIPICILADIPIVTNPLFASTPSWPCQNNRAYLDGQRHAHLLEQAGLLRFEQKTEGFVEQVHHLQNTGDDDAYDTCLLLALAEGLAYGRDRAFFRAAGLRLLQKTSPLPEPLGRSPQPSPLDDSRLHVLARMHSSWRIPGPWRTLHAQLLPASVQSPPSHAEIFTTLHTTFSSLGLSLARADILICNVVLPFAAAIGLLENRPQLTAQARALYLHHPGLPSNRITRMMRAQLQLSHEPRGTCRQQGLHYIYQQTCRAKCCDQCLFGRNRL